MANTEQLNKITEEGVEGWNRWRDQNPSIEPDLTYALFFTVDLTMANFSYADLSRATLTMAKLIEARLNQAVLYEANLSRADLSRADLRGAYFSEEANLYEADLTEANLTGANLNKASLYYATLTNANLSRADLTGADLNGADLSGASLFDVDLIVADISYANLAAANLINADLRNANLTGANLSRADLSGANLTNADLTGSTLVRTNLAGTTLTGCRIYGISAWDLELEGTKEENLVISPKGEPIITVDHIEVAQFVYLLLHNEKIRQVIDTVTSKAVLILGRFTEERKAILDAIRDALRQRGYLPILFDFDKPASRDLTETVSTLAHMARFIIADITEPKSIPQELQAIVPNLPSVPVQPLLQKGDSEYPMFDYFRRFPWVLDTYKYDTLDDVLTDLGEKIISPAEAKANELAR